MYLESFSLPLDLEEDLIEKRMTENGGIYGYIDNIYPCGLFRERRNCRRLTSAISPSSTAGTGREKAPCST